MNVTDPIADMLTRIRNGNTAGKDVVSMPSSKVLVTDKGSIPHDVIGEFGAGRVLVKPAIEGTGVIAGGPVRPLFELAGIKNVLSKSMGSSNGLNIIKAAAEALKQLSSPEETAERRGITVAEMFVGKEN